MCVSLHICGWWHWAHWLSGRDIRLICSSCPTSVLFILYEDVFMYLIISCHLRALGPTSPVWVPVVEKKNSPSRLDEEHFMGINKMCHSQRVRIERGYIIPQGRLMLIFECQSMSNMPPWAKYCSCEKKAFHGLLLMIVKASHPSLLCNYYYYYYY